MTHIMGMHFDHIQTQLQLQGLPLEADPLVQSAFQIFISQQVIIVAQVKCQPEATYDLIVLEKITDPHARKRTKARVEVIRTGGHLIEL